VAEGAELVVDGRKTIPDGDADGFWLGPTLFDKVTPEMSLYNDEIFGPCSQSWRVASYEAALELVNSNPYGNGTAIFTNDGGAARRFQNEVEVGMVGINVPIPVPVSYYPSVAGRARYSETATRTGRGRPFLHARQGGDQPVAGPEPRRNQPRVPAEHLSAASLRRWLARRLVDNDSAWRECGQSHRGRGRALWRM